jgi:hypothetical protein
MLYPSPQAVAVAKLNAHPEVVAFHYFQRLWYFITSRGCGISLLPAFVLMVWVMAECHVYYLDGCHYLDGMARTVLLG